MKSLTANFDSQKFNGKDVILLVGPSGSGKVQSWTLLLEVRLDVKRTRKINGKFLQTQMLLKLAMVLLLLFYQISG